MTDPSPDAGVEPDRTPRWVKVFGIIALAVIVLFVVLLIAKGPHNPGRHTGVDGMAYVVHQR